MDLKSDRSGLWRHMLVELVVGWDYYVANIQNNVARHDKTAVKSTHLSRDKNMLSRNMSFMSHRSDIMLRLFYI